MEGYCASTYGDRSADIYDEIQGDRGALRAVDFLAAVANGRPALELGVGTGRIAVPLAARGIRVHGIDASSEMLNRLREKPGGEAVTVTLGDIAQLDVPGPFGLVFAVYGTIFCLTTQDAQVHCFRHVARVLADGGAFVIEASVPDFSAFTRGQNVRVSKVETNRVIATFTRHDRAAQTTATQHVVIADNGIRLIPAFFRYAWPSELDLMAQLAGLELAERWEDWDRKGYTAQSLRHVSLYRKRAR